MFVRGDADACIGNGKFQNDFFPAIFLDRVHGHGDTDVDTAVFGEFHGIGYEVDEHLLEA